MKNYSIRVSKLGINLPNEGKLEDDDYYGHEVFTCKYCEDCVKDDILEERMLGNYQVPLCEVCVNPLKSLCNTCFERTCDGGRRCEQFSH